MPPGRRAKLQNYPVHGAGTAHRPRTPFSHTRVFNYTHFSGPRRAMRKAFPLHAARIVTEGSRPWGGGGGGGEGHQDFSPAARSPERGGLA